MKNLIKISICFLLLLCGFLAPGCKPPPAGEGSFKCQKDADCTTPEAPHCNSSGECVECLNAEQCGSCHIACLEGSCVYLEDRGDVGAYNGEITICLPENECSAALGNCCKLGFFCDIYSGRCLKVADYTRSCTTENPCPDGEVCDIYHNVCVPQPSCASQYNCCTVDEKIAGLPMACSLSTGRCNDYEIVCTPPAEPTSRCPYLPKEEDECDSGKFCVDPGICVQCTCDADCPKGSNLVCNLATGLCKSPYSCQVNGDCNSNSQLCDPTIGRCVTKCTFDFECGYEEYCEKSLNMCRPESQRPCQPDSYEPNDDKNSAALLEEKQQLVEAVKCPSDIDWYILPLKRADAVTIKIYETNQSSGTIYLEAYMPDGETLIGESNNGFFGKPISFTANSDGNYYLLAYTTSAGTAMSYSISIIYGTGEVCTDAPEVNNGANDDPQNASDLFQGYGNCRLDLSAATRKKVTCESGEMLICAGDKDYYLLHMKDGEVLKAKLSGQLAPLKMAVFGPVAAGATLETALMATGAALTEQSLTLAARPGGDYLLLVYAAGMEQTAYNLEVVISDSNKELSCLEDNYDAINYNDVFINYNNELIKRAPESKATLLDIGELPGAQDSLPIEILKNNLSLCAGDQDTYAPVLKDGQSFIIIPAGYKFEAALIGATEEVSLRLYAASAGGELTQVAAASIDNQNILLPITGGQKIWLAVFGENPQKMYEYSLAVRLTPPPACAGDQFEPNNSPLVATSLPGSGSGWTGGPGAAGHYGAAGDQVANLSLCTGDTDWYKLTPPAGTTLRVDIAYNSELPSPFAALYGPEVLQAADMQDAATWPGLILAAQELYPGLLRLRLVAAGGQPVYLVLRDGEGWPLSAYQMTISYQNESCIEDELTAAAANTSAQDAYLLPLTHESGDLYSYFNSELTICGNGSTEDWFAVTAGGDDLLDIKVLYQYGEGNLDLYLYPPSAMLSASSGQHVAYSWDDTAPYTGLLHIAYKVPSGQPQQNWPFVVRPYASIGSTAFNNLYALWVTTRRLCLNDSIGAVSPPAVMDGQSDQGYLTYIPQNFAAYSPAALPLNGSALSGEGALCGNEDWLLIKLDEANGGLANGLTACAFFDHSAGDIDLALYKASDLQNPLLESATKRGYERIMLTSPAESGYYYLRVFLDPRDSGNKVSYKLKVFGGADYAAAGCDVP